MDELKDLIANNSEVFEDYFVNTTNLAIVIIDSDLNITMTNRCFNKLIGNYSDSTGESIYSYLLPESLGYFTGEKTADGQSLLLNFKSDDSTPVPLKCHLISLDKGRQLILGGNLMLTNEDILEKMTVVTNEMTNMARELHRKNRKLHEAQAQIKILAGIVPICMHCKSIRDDEGYWNQLEKYISEHSEASFSHGICDDCIKKYYPEINSDLS